MFINQLTTIFMWTNIGSPNPRDRLLYIMSIQHYHNIIFIILIIPAKVRNVTFSVSEHRLMNLNADSVSLMTQAVTRPAPAWNAYNYEHIIPANVYGRYVYTYLMGSGVIYIRELEVFAPFAFGEKTFDSIACPGHGQD